MGRGRSAATRSGIAAVLAGAMTTSHPERSRPQRATQVVPQLGASTPISSA